jgi:hypothetical protein
MRVAGALRSDAAFAQLQAEDRAFTIDANILSQLGHLEYKVKAS